MTGVYAVMASTLLIEMISAAVFKIIRFHGNIFKMSVHNLTKIGEGIYYVRAGA